MFISRSIPLYYQLVQAGETADLFHSFAPVGDELICAFRRHRIVDYAEWGSGENYYESRIMTQRFDISTGTALSAPEEAMAMGEDPRCFSVQGRPFILGANPIGGNFNYVLFDVHAKKSLNIEVTNRVDFKYGKNWQPFVAGDRLYAVHGFSPFRILQIDVDTGQAEVVFERGVGFDAISPHDGYTQYRGGCQALVIGDKVVGFGHQTIDPGRHSVFQWTFSPASRQVSIAFDLDFGPFADCGLKIVDPTCFFAHQEKYYLGVSCSNRDWFYGQTFASLLLELQLDGNEQRTGESLESVLGNPLPAEPAATRGNPSVYFFRAGELLIGNGTPSRNFEVVSKVGQDDPGHVIFGPYINLSPGSYQLRLQYAGSAPTLQEIGELDACSNAGGVVLGRRPLFGTGGKLLFAALDFKIADAAQGTGFEVRVGSKGIANLRLTDVSVSRVP